MLELSRVRVRSLDRDYLDVSWEIPKSQFREDPRNYSFRVLRSDAEEGEYSPVTREFSDRYLFRDSTASTSSQVQKWYYRIRVKRLADSSQVDYPSVGGACLEAEADLEALEISRQIQLRLNEYNGREVYLLQRKTFGQRCSVCYDFVTQTVRQSGCLTCFDTSYVGGYHPPVRVVMGISTSESPTVSVNQAAKQVTNVSQGKLANYPEITAGSIVVEEENTRWIVLGPIRRTTKLRALIKQTFSLSEVLPSDVVYKFPLKAPETDAIDASPDRQFTLPADPLYYSRRSTEP